MGMQDPGLVEEREPAFRLQHALDHEHHVGASGVVLVEHQGAGMLIRPRQNSLAEFRDLPTVAETLMASLPTRSIRLMWLSRLTRMHGQLSRAATCSMCVDFPVP